MKQTQDMIQKKELLVKGSKQIIKVVYPVKCHRCSYEWDFSGKNLYLATCPHCGTKVSIRKQIVLPETTPASDLGH
jgi:DNA-directed RNA polymerase subunit RPC12/RpoP